MFTQISRLVILAASGFALASFSVVAEDKAEGVSEEKAEITSSKRTCLWANSISGWSEIDDRHLLVRAPTRSKTYLMSFKRSCRDMKWAQKIAVDSFSNRICSNSQAKIIPLDTHAHRHFGCYVDDIVRVKDKEAALKLIEAAAASKEQAEAQASGEAS